MSKGSSQSKVSSWIHVQVPAAAAESMNFVTKWHQSEKRIKKLGETLLRGYLKDGPRSSSLSLLLVLGQITCLLVPSATIESVTTESSVVSSPKYQETVARTKISSSNNLSPSYSRPSKSTVSLRSCRCTGPYRSPGRIVCPTGPS